MNRKYHHRQKIAKWSAYAALFCTMLVPSLTFASNVLRDPTKPPSYDAPDSEDSSVITINSTLISKNRAIAVINGQVVTAGTTINGLVIAKIGNHEVYFTDANGDTLAIPVFQNMVKQPTKQKDSAP